MLLMHRKCLESLMRRVNQGYSQASSSLPNPDTGGGIPLNILIDLMQRCGCVRDMNDMSGRGRDMRVVEIVDRLTSKSGMNVVTVDWVLNCIGGWRVL